MQVHGCGKKGRYFFPLQVYYYQTDYAFDSDGSLEKRDGIFWKKEINPYFEYGLTNKDILQIKYDLSLTLDTILFCLFKSLGVMICTMS